MRPATTRAHWQTEQARLSFDEARTKTSFIWITIVFWHTYDSVIMCRKRRYGDEFALSRLPVASHGDVVTFPTCLMNSLVSCIFMQLLKSAFQSRLSDDFGMFWLSTRQCFGQLHANHCKKTSKTWHKICAIYRILSNFLAYCYSLNRTSNDWSSVFYPTCFERDIFLSLLLLYEPVYFPINFLRRK